MKSAIFGGVLLLACASAFADNGVYLGAGITQSRIDNVGGGGGFADFHIHDDEWKLIGGVRLLSFLGAEVNYMDLGRRQALLSSSSFRADAKAWSGYLVGYIPVPFVDLYGKVGAARTTLDTKFDAFTINESHDTSTNFAYGVGAQIKLGSIAARVEYERFDIHHTDGVQLLTLGGTYTFL